MRSTIAALQFVLLLLASFALLALGWLMSSVSGPTRRSLFDLHVSLGVVALAAIVALAVVRIVVPPPPHPDVWSAARRRLAGLLEFLVYLAFLTVAASGLLWAVLSGSQLQVFGAPLPAVEPAYRPLAELAGPFWGGFLRALGARETTAPDIFLAIHHIFVWVLVASILAYLLIGGASRFHAPRRAPPPAQRPTPPVPLAPSSAAAPPPAASPVLAFAGQLRPLGWVQFWIQLVLGLASGVLLQFATSGRAFSPSASGYGDAIYWSFYAFLLLWIGVALAFYYTRVAHRIADHPDYLGGARLTAFWFVSAGLLVSLAGTIISFIGVSLSISLLIAKIVSQPPGIAITDPNRIIRALDIFVLLVNFMLLLGHFVGAGVAGWLGAGAAQARFRYATTTRPAAE